VLVLDDGSGDDTARRVEAAGGAVRLLRGTPPPPGWLGKNWACWQLARAARGDVLLFCDADVRPEPGAVLATAALLERRRADGVTALPRPVLGSWAEAAVVPLVAQLPAVALLPLPLVPLTRRPSLSMANGQWLAFRREAYRRCGGHRAVRSTVLEDVALGRRLKASGGRLVVAVAAGLLSVRMYRGTAEVRAGFRKNLYPLLGARPVGLAAALLVLALTAVYPWAGAAMGSRAALAPLALLLGVRAGAALLLRHPLRSVILHPVGALLAGALAVESWWALRRGRAGWKGRPVALVNGR
jgi:glycosyltransferase involved in cell wall biosynthesis